MEAKEEKLNQQKYSSKWHEWDSPDEDVSLEMARKAIQFIRFLHPDIIFAIVEDNEKHHKEFAKKLEEHKIDPSIYLWKNSSCAFPGIRRHAGKREIATFRKLSPNRKIDNALRLDDNHFPKQIWSYILCGTNFKNYGPDGYSLAHLADHKDYKNRIKDEFISTKPWPAHFYGLFTCVSNTVFIPNNFLRLTDFNNDIRMLLHHKAQELYGEFCNLVPPGISLKPLKKEWEKQFTWAEPVSPKYDIKQFLDYRLEIMNKL